MGQEWYYLQDGQNAGPVEQAALEQMAAAGQLGPDDLVWREGMAEWAPFSQIAELASQSAGAEAAVAEAAVATPAVAEAPLSLNYFTPRTVVYAGFWRRFLAFLIDWLILLIPLAVTNAGIMIALGATHQIGSVRFPVVGEPYLLEEVLTDLATLLIAIAYFALQESSARQATVGKRTLGLYVTDLRGRRLSFNQAAARVVAKQLHMGFNVLAAATAGSAAPPVLELLAGLYGLITYTMAGYTPHKQAFHDMLASTLVLRKVKR